MTLFRALYKLERGKKRIGGWVRDNHQIPDSPNLAIQGTFFSGVIREESQIPENDQWIIDDNNLLQSMSTTSPIVQKTQSEAVSAENNIRKMKEVFRDHILYFVPLESQLTGLISCGEKFASQQQWVNDKLLLLKKGIEEIRNSESDSFTIRNKYVKMLEESAPPEQVSVLDLVDSAVAKVPLVQTISLVEQSSFNIGSGNVIGITLRESDTTVTELSVTNEISQNYLTSPSVNYQIEDNLVLQNQPLPDDFDTQKVAGVLSLEFPEGSVIEYFTLKCSESSSSIYASINGEAKKYIKLNEVCRVDSECESLQFTIPKRLQKIGPLIVAVMKPQIEENYTKTIILPSDCLVHITRDEGVNFAILKDGSRFLPTDNQGSILMMPVRQPQKLSTTVYGGDFAQNLVFPVTDECQLELVFTDENRRSIDVKIEKLGRRYSYTTINHWEQIDSTIILEEKVTGDLLVTRI